jgi:hypothetical protein
MVHQRLEPRVLVSLVINLVINTQGSHKVGLPYLSCVWPALQRSRPQLHNSFCVLNVKCTLVQALRLCTGRTAHRESRGIALPFLDHGTRRGWGVSVTPRPIFTPGKEPVPVVQETGWAPGPVWTGAENLAAPGFDPQTVQPLASRYTDWATGPTNFAKAPTRRTWNMMDEELRSAEKWGSLDLSMCDGYLTTICHRALYVTSTCSTVFN